MWRFEFEAPVGQRVLKRFMCVTTYEHNFWWSEEHKMFTCFNHLGNKGGGSSHGVHSFKAFKRFLRKHPELQGTEVVLVSRFMGHNITAKYEVTE